MYHHFKTKALFLKKSQQNEADLLFALYTENFGKIKVLGKAIRKPESKLASGAQLFYLSVVEFVEGKAGKILTDAVLVKRFKNIENEEQRLLTAQDIASKIDEVFSQEEKDEKAWQLITSTFRELNQTSNSPSQTLDDFCQKITLVSGC